MGKSALSGPGGGCGTRSRSFGSISQEQEETRRREKDVSKREAVNRFIISF